MMPSAENAGSEVAVIKPARVSVGVPVWRTMLWSVRREIWENRSVYIAPAVVAGGRAAVGRLRPCAASAGAGAAGGDGTGDRGRT
jgi:hypothetical protein